MPQPMIGQLPSHSMSLSVVEKKVCQAIPPMLQPLPLPFVSQFVLASQRQCGCGHDFHTSIRNSYHVFALHSPKLTHSINAAKSEKPGSTTADNGICLNRWPCKCPPEVPRIPLIPQTHLPSHPRRPNFSSMCPPRSDQISPMCIPPHVPRSDQISQYVPRRLMCPVATNFSNKWHVACTPRRPNLSNMCPALCGPWRPIFSSM